MSDLRVLAAHTYYRQQGGEDRSFESEVRMLQDAGIEVATFIRRNDDLSAMSAWQVAQRSIWNVETARQLDEVWAREGPFDVVHFQNTFPLMSPSVLWAAHRRGAAVVQSLRNYRGFCVNGLLFRDGGVCEACVRRSVAWPGVVHACYRGSRGASAAVAASNAFHRMVGTWRHAVDRFVTMSEFTRAKYVEAGYDGDRIAVKPNFLTPDPGVGPGDGGFALFVGRLSPGKGIETLLRAWTMLGADLPLLVAGSGPLEPTVREAADGVRVRWLGQRSAADALDLMGRASVLVFPSESFETFGRVVIEAFAKGTPVVAARVGAVTDLIEDGRTGATFAPGDERDLVRQLHRVLDHADPMTLRGAARRAFEARYTADRNLDATLALYREAIAVAKARSGNAAHGRRGMGRWRP